MYRALVERDQSFEGLFFACVRTTGIFCRPTCHARKPKPENVEFAPTIQEALHRGYRPCRVCEPMSAGAAAPNWLAPLLDEIRRSRTEAAGPRPARPRARSRAGPAHLQAQLRDDVPGLSARLPARDGDEGAARRRADDSTPAWTPGSSPTAASATPSRASSARRPADARGTALLTAAWIETPLGPMLAIAGDAGLELLEFVDRRALETELRELRRTLGRDRPRRSSDPAPDARSSSASTSPARGATFDLPLKQRGSAFQLAAWQALCEIPYGETRSYTDMARGGRLARRGPGDRPRQRPEPLAIVVPCHRVIRADGTLCGYGGGRWRKQWLLDHERAVATK